MPINVHRFISRDDGVASAIAVALIATGMLLALGVGQLLAASSARANLQELSDTVARHAADMQRGAQPGYPCEFATQYLDLQGAKLTNCRILGNDVAIEATVNFSLWVLTAKSQAGPI